MRLCLRTGGWLVYLVYLVCLVCLVKPDRPARLDRPDEPDHCALAEASLEFAYDRAVFMVLGSAILYLLLSVGIGLAAADGFIPRRILQWLVEACRCRS